MLVMGWSNQGREEALVGTVTHHNHSKIIGLGGAAHKILHGCDDLPAGLVSLPARAFFQNRPQSRVTDHRIGLTVHQLDRILQGELDEFTEALTTEDRRQALGE